MYRNTLFDPKRWPFPHWMSGIVTQRLRGNKHLKMFGFTFVINKLKQIGWLDSNRVETWVLRNRYFNIVTATYTAVGRFRQPGRRLYLTQLHSLLEFSVSIKSLEAVAVQLLVGCSIHCHGTRCHGRPATKAAMIDTDKVTTRIGPRRLAFSPCIGRAAARAAALIKWPGRLHLHATARQQEVSLRSWTVLGCSTV